MSAVGYDVATHACDEDSFEYLLRVVSDIIPYTLPATAAPDTILRETFEQYVVPNDQGIYPPMHERRELLGLNEEAIAQRINRMKGHSNPRVRWLGLYWEQAVAARPYLHARALSPRALQEVKDPVLTRPDTAVLNGLISILQADWDQCQHPCKAEYFGLLQAARGLKQSIEKKVELESPSTPPPSAARVSPENLSRVTGLKSKSIV